ncbi:MAG: hypothetical protein V1722_00305 [Candidatus Micrarchaeota archaeon]
MAKVVLVWNEHPTEVIAGHHCRQVAKLLREMGHEVIVKKIAARDTIYGTVQHDNYAAAGKKLLNTKPTAEITEEFAKNFNAITFNFHGYAATALRRYRAKKPERLKIKEKLGKSSLIIRGDICFYRISPHAFAIEIPGIMEKLPREKRAVQKERLNQALYGAIKAKERANVGKSLLKRIGDHSMQMDQILNTTDAKYHLNRMPMNLPAQQNFKSPVISEKIAAAIHERLTSQRVK